MRAQRELRFFVDESLMGIGKIMAIARRGEVTHPDHDLIPDVHLGDGDPKWMPVVAKRGLIVIARDGRLRFRDGEKDLLRPLAMRVIRLGGRKDLDNWGYLSLLVKHWNDIESFITSRPLGPWCLRVLPSEGLREEPVP